MKKYLNALMIATVLVSAPLQPKWVNSPSKLSLWLMTNFTYQKEKFKFIDYWKRPEETLRDKGGDCEDFAFLVDRILSDLGYDTEVRGFCREDKKACHAICLIKQNEKYTFFSNKYYLSQEHDSIEKLLTNNYPTWEYHRRIYQNKKVEKRIKRK